MGGIIVPADCALHSMRMVKVQQSRQRSSIAIERPIQSGQPFKSSRADSRWQREDSRKESAVRKVWLVMCFAVTSSLFAGCRCCPLMNPYANAVDDVSDSHLHFDNWYHPRWDISRAGKPDWCGENGRRPWYCCREGAWTRHDDCNLYPPSYPYSHPGTAFLQSSPQTEVTPAPANVQPYEAP